MGIIIINIYFLKVCIVKKSIKILSIVLVLVCLCATLASCGSTLSGTYSASAGDTSLVGGKTEYTFKGKNVTIAVTAGALGFEKTTEFEGTYEIKDDKITFTFDSEDKGDDAYNGSFDFEKGDGFIKISGVKYTEVE